MGTGEVKEWSVSMTVLAAKWWIHDRGIPYSLQGMVRQMGVMSYVLAREMREEYRVTVE